jgi:tetrapyrrole methylase family protein/MazG family protein
MSGGDFGDKFSRLVEIMARLRGPGGCPWDREQTHATLRPYLVEETYEVLEALDEGSPEAFREELGDLLLQIVFHAQLAAEEGRFTIGDVIESITEKLTRRHPHVFGDAKVKDAGEVLRNWSKIKADEREAKSRGRRRSVLDGVPSSAPALVQAQRLGEKASRVGFDWPAAIDVARKVREEVAELEEAMATGDRARQEEELGDLLLALTSLARLLGLDAEMALRAAVRRFTGRFHFLEGRVREAGRDIHGASAAELEALWDEAKKAGR